MSTSQLPREANLKDVPQEKSEASRRGGRIVPSRYMNATASSRAAATSKGASTVQRPSSSTLGSFKGGPAVSTRTKPPSSASLTTKQRKAPSQPSSLSTSRASKPPSRPLINEPTATRSAPALELDVASQLYSWLFMRHTLTEASNAAATRAQAILAARAKDLDDEERALADDRLRYQVERETQLIDELSNEHICRAAPPLIRTFVQSRGRYEEAMFYAARITRTDSHHEWNVKDSRMRLHDLEQFIEELTVLRAAIGKLTCATPPNSLLAPTLEGLLCSLDARLENLRLYSGLLATMTDNFMTLCHLESLSLSIRDL